MAGKWEGGREVFGQARVRLALPLIRRLNPMTSREMCIQLPLLTTRAAVMDRCTIGLFRDTFRSAA